MGLTDPNFWDGFWNNISIPVRINYNLKNDRIIAKAFADFAPKGPDLCSFEVGCAPGKWMVYLREHFGYFVAGCEYLPAAVEKTKENLSYHGFSEKDFRLISGDFFEMDEDTQYDLVYSFGFIEHFEDPEKVLDAHLRLLKPGGRLIVGLPSFRGVNYRIQKIIDNYIHNPLLPAHNLEAMNPWIYKDYGRLRGLKVLFSGFVGGFEPSLFNASVIENTITRFFIYKLLGLLSRLFKYRGNSNFGSFILVVIEKPI